MLAVEVHGLSKRYDKFLAVDNISFAVPQGEFFGFLGPNGAGKSTTIRVLCGLLAGDYQSIRIAGHDLRTDSIGVKSRIGVMLEDPMLYERLSAPEHLEFTGMMYGLEREIARERSAELIRLLDLQAAGSKLIVDFSQGMRKKVALGCALIHEPRVLFLDEPFNGIDTVSSHQIKQLLQKRVAQGVTIMFSSHVMEVVEKLCTSLAIIHQGRIRLEASMADLKSRPNWDGLEAEFIRTVGSISGMESTEANPEMDSP
ncbi:ABC transporter ATP-binding protein [bacterium]|nr:ABC transporter ATP-binding protein [bacterium]